MRLHQQTTFLICDQRGDITAGSENGLYADDLRFLSELRLTLDGEAPVPLLDVVESETAALHVLGNPGLAHAGRSALTLTRRRQLGDGFHETLEVEAFGPEAVSFAVELHFAADFVDIFEVKQAAASHAQAQLDAPGPIARKLVDGGHGCELSIVLRGQERTVRLTFDRKASWSDGCARFAVALPAHGRWQLALDVLVRNDAAAGRRGASPADVENGAPERARRQRQLEDVGCRLDTDHAVLQAAYARAARDLSALRLKSEETDAGESIAAGIPWYMALFGRDSLIAGYQTLLHDPLLTRGTLEALARLQGTRDDESSLEEPGKILHEYRKHLRASASAGIPQYPYYGSVDATPLFVITLAAYVRATGDLDFARAMWPHLERAIGWMRGPGGIDGDGLLSYCAAHSPSASNQCWKDSPDSIRFRDGRIVRQPERVKAVEVQGYAADAFARAADVAAALGRDDEGTGLRVAAAQMRERIRARYWMVDRRFFAEALDGSDRKVDSLTSNPGQLLWSRAISDADARRVAEVLLSPELFSGFGIRTMGANEGGYDPLSYHNGTVWPHDNSLIVDGLGRYGLDDAVRRVAAGLLAAIAFEPDYRPPELFAGYSSDRYGRPARYPMANAPQAWASGAVILMTRVLAGVDVDAASRRLTVRPIGLAGMTRLHLTGLPVAASHVAVRIAFDGASASVDVDGLPPDWELDAAGR